MKQLDLFKPPSKFRDKIGDETVQAVIEDACTKAAALPPNDFRDPWPDKRSFESEATQVRLDAGVIVLQVRPTCSMCSLCNEVAQPYGPPKYICRGLNKPCDPRKPPLDGCPVLRHTKQVGWDNYVFEIREG